jgi:hypothetical protein
MTGTREWRSWKTSPFGGPGALVWQRGTPRGVSIVSCCDEPRAEAWSPNTSGRSRWCRRTCQRRCQRLGGRIRRNPSERTLPKSLTTRVRVAALKLIGQPASRGPPRGRTHRGSEDFRCRVGLDRARFRLDPPGPGKSARLCRARGADLSRGRSLSREGNPQGVDAMPSIACRRRVSIRVFSDQRAA